MQPRSARGCTAQRRQWPVREARSRPRPLPMPCRRSCVPCSPDGPGARSDARPDGRMVGTMTRTPGYRRAEIVVDRGAIRRNVERLREHVADAQVMVVVKADGYGHGIVEAARAARAGGATWLGVADRAEALALRAAGDTGRILSWLGMPGEDFAPLVEADVDVAAYSGEQLQEVVAATVAAGRPARVHLKVDTGLSRGGAPRRDWPALVEAAVRAEADGAVQVTGVWSHFACSDEPGHPANDAQHAAFEEALTVAAGAGLRPEVRHLANSA